MNDAIAQHRKLLDQYPNNELARFSLGKAYFDAGQIQDALGEFQLALEKKPDWMVVQILIGKCELALGNASRARECFAQARQLAIAQRHEGPQAEMEQLLSEME